MAVSWDTQITNVNTNSKRASLRFTRTDTADPTGDFSVNFNQVIIETGPERTALLNQVWGEWQDEAAKRASVLAFITNLEQLANANLDAREV